MIINNKVKNILNKIMSVDLRLNMSNRVSPDYSHYVSVNMT